MSGKTTDFPPRTALLPTDQVGVVAAGNNYRATLADVAGARISFVAGYGRSVRLDTFISTYAAPGQSIVFSDGTDVATNIGAQMSTINQAQRRVNFRIFVEACLYACGGTGAANAGGWYSAPTAVQEANSGSLFVPGPFWIEPYDTTGLAANNNYAPGWPHWTLPACLTLWGNGKSLAGGPSGVPNIASGSARSRMAPRIITVNSPIGWDPAGGPVPSNQGRHLNHWTVDGVSFARRGSTDGDVFYTGHYFDAVGAVHQTEMWHIREMAIEQDGNTYSGVPNVQNGFVNRGGGVDCAVDNLIVWGNNNLGYGLINSGALNYARNALSGGNFVTRYGKLCIQGGRSGLAFIEAGCFIELLNMEASAPTPHRLWLNGCYMVKIGMIHCEQANTPTSGDDAIVVVGGTPVLSAVEGATSAVSSSNISYGCIENAYFIANSGNPSASNPDFGILVRTGIMTLGTIWGGGMRTSIIRVDGLSGNPANAAVEFNSRHVGRVGGSKLTYGAGGTTYITDRSGQSGGAWN